MRKENEEKRVGYEEAINALFTIRQPKKPEQQQTRGIGHI